VETHSAAGIHHNASPTAVFWEDWFILSSARPLALELAELVKGQSSAAAGINSSLVVNVSEVQTALAENREPLVARNMLDRGHDRAAAQQEIDTLLKALALVRRSSLKLAAEQGRIELTVEVAFAGH
jgi:hypothetical protein